MNIPQSFIDPVDRLCDEQKAKKEPRRIVQIAAVSATEYSRFTYVATCNDGTAWSLCPGYDLKWEQLPEIPQ
jgi:hypothetical protein